MNMRDSLLGGGMYRHINNNASAPRQQQQQQQPQQQQQSRMSQQQHQHQNHQQSAGGGGGGAPPAPVESNEDENNLRTTCDSCTIGKIKCDGGHPCKRCLRRGSECVYREKKRCGPKRRKSVQTHDSDEDGSNPGADNGSSVVLDGGSGCFRVLTAKEQGFLSKFFSSVNKFIPVTSITVIRDAMNPLQLDIVDGASPTEAEKDIFHSRKAVLLGCVAVGAVFSGDQGSAGVYLSRAQLHLKDCFDALLAEVVCCYLVMVIYYLHFMDRAKVYRYMGFAQQAYRELVQSQQLTHVGAGHVRDSLLMLSTFLHVTCNNEVRIDPLYLEPENYPEQGVGSLSRIIAHFSHVFLQMYWRSNPEAAASFSPQQPLLATATLQKMADEADLLMSMIEEPGSFAMIAIKTVKGYFMLLNGEEQDVLHSVARPVAKAVEADPGVLNFPLCWSMCNSVCGFLRRKGCHDVADVMDGIMLPLQSTLVYANMCCRVALMIRNAYTGENPCGTTFSGAAAAAAAASGAPSAFPSSSSSSSSPPTPMSAPMGDKDSAAYYGRSDLVTGGGRDTQPPPSSLGLPASLSSGAVADRHTERTQHTQHPRYGSRQHDGDSEGANRRTGGAGAEASTEGAPQRGLGMLFPSADGGSAHRNGNGNGNGAGGRAGPGAVARGGTGGGSSGSGSSRGDSERPGNPKKCAAAPGALSASSGGAGSTGNRDHEEAQGTMGSGHGGGGGGGGGGMLNHHFDHHMSLSTTRGRLEKMSSMSSMNSVGLDGGGSDHPHSLSSQPLSFDLGAGGTDGFFLGLKPGFEVSTSPEKPKPGRPT